MPVRTCVGCRTAAPITELVRLARSAEGMLSLDRKLPGRGAWLCVGDVEGMPAPTCFEQAVRRHAFNRAFPAPVEAAAVAALREKVQERARIERGGAFGAPADRRD